MSRTLFARHNYAKAPQYRLLTTIEQEDDAVYVYKKASTAAAQPYLEQLLANQRTVREFVAERAQVVEGDKQDDGRIRYPFIALPSVQKLICEDILRDDYPKAYQRITAWIAWLEALPTVERIPSQEPKLVAIYGDTLQDEAVTCIELGLIDLTTENVFWNEQTQQYSLIDHDILLTTPVPRDIIIFRTLFFLCHNLRILLQNAAERHPLQIFAYKGFLVPQEWDFGAWINTEDLPRLFQAEARFQSYFAGKPVTIELEVENSQIDTRPRPTVATRLAQQDAVIISTFEKHKHDIVVYQQWIKERDEHIEELRADIVHKQADIATLQSWVVERDDIIRKNEQDIELFKQWIAERDVGIVAIYDRLPMAQGQFNLVEQQLISLQEQLRATEEQLQRAERDVQTLHGWVADRDAQILHMHEVAAGYNARAMQLEAELNSIYGSMLGRLSQKVWRARQAVLPSNGFLLRNARRARNAFGILRRGGPRSLAQHSLGWARYKLKRGKQAEKSAPAIVQIDTPAALSVAESNYLQWIALNEPNEQELQKQRLESHLLVYQPLLSIVTPVYNPPPALLEAMIDSVIAQSYGNWELVLVNGSPENPAVQAVIDKARARDRRIAIVNLAANQGIVGNTNAGLAEAHGEFIVFVDHDDTIAPFALYEVAKLLNQDPATDMLYSDSDLLSYDGTKRFQPLFKPDWSPAIMLSANYATHLCVIRTSVVEQLGGLAAGSDGAQDWDLILRVSEQTSRIRHLPKILYHWRESPTSTAIDISQKPYALQAQFGVIQRHLARKGIQAEVSLDKTGYIRAIWPVQANPLVSIIIPSRKLSLLQRCIQTIQQHTNYKRYELIVVDTTPQGEIAHFYAKSTVQVVHYTEPFNYSAVNNRAAKLAKGEVLLFLNDDTEAFEPDWLEEMLRWVQREEVGVVGAKLLRENGLLQHAGVVIGLSGFADHPFANGPEGQHTIYGCTEWYRNFSAVTGACLMIRRALFEQVGGFDELLVLCGNDVELCLRVGKLGYQVIYTPFARLLHLESVTRGSSSIPPADFTGSYLHYYPLLEQGDPFYNPNLSHWSLLPQVRQPEEEASLAFTQRFLVQNGLSVPTIVSTEAE
jgi:GT2 family glycosyltransferase